MPEKRLFSALAAVISLIPVAACSAPIAPPRATSPCEAVPERALTGRVSDHAGVLDAEAEARLDTQLAALAQRRGHQTVIATVPTLDGRDIAAEATCLGNRWGIGDTARDDGILVLVATSDRKVRVATGTGATASLTDDEAAEVIGAMTPAFRDGDMAGGLEQGIARIEALTGPGTP